MFWDIDSAVEVLAIALCAIMNSLAIRLWVI